MRAFGGFCFRALRALHVLFRSLCCLPSPSLWGFLEQIHLAFLRRTHFLRRVARAFPREELLVAVQKVDHQLRVVDTHVTKDPTDAQLRKSERIANGSALSDGKEKGCTSHRYRGLWRSGGFFSRNEAAKRRQLAVSTKERSSTTGRPIFQTTHSKGTHLHALRVMEQDVLNHLV